MKSLSPKSHYNPWKLVDHRYTSTEELSDQPINIICDIDKTYLETKFESLFQMARIPFESPSDKVAVPGVTKTLQALRWGGAGKNSTLLKPRNLHFVSSSPPQLRSVIQEKLSLDGLDWTSDIFKDQVYNIKKRKFNLLKQQVVFKSLAILHLFSLTPNPSSFWLIGDNAESDPFIYLGCLFFAQKRLSPTGYEKYLSLWGVDSETAASIAQLKISDSTKVSRICIRIIKKPYYLPKVFENYIFSFEHYSQVFQLAVKDQIIAPEQEIHEKTPYIQDSQNSSQDFLTEEEILSISEDWSNQPK